MQSNAATVEEYLASLPEDRRAAVSAVRDVINEHLPEGYAEQMDYASLASQRNHLAVYLMGLDDTDGPELEWFRRQYAERGMKLDMGKSCVRFKGLEEVPLDVLGEAIGMTPVDEFVARARTSRRKR